MRAADTFFVRCLQEANREADLGNMIWPEVENFLLTTWFPTYGRPDMVRMDPEGCFRSNQFGDSIEAMGMRVDQVPTEAHWRNGPAERMVELLKEAGSRQARRHPDLSFDTLFGMISAAHADQYFHRGYTPAQLLMGQAAARHRAGPAQR